MSRVDLLQMGWLRTWPGPGGTSRALPPSATVLVGKRLELLKEKYSQALPRRGAVGSTDLDLALTFLVFVTTDSTALVIILSLSICRLALYS
jgi:hypothetical protein